MADLMYKNEIKVVFSENKTLSAIGSMQGWYSSCVGTLFNIQYSQFTKKKHNVVNLNFFCYLSFHLKKV